LPVKFDQIERTDVSATLGKDSLKEAKKAALLGLILVAIFLLAIYRFLGLVAVIGLGIYAAFLYAAILIFGVTLTLPGFAGLILLVTAAAATRTVLGLLAGVKWFESPRVRGAAGQQGAGWLHIDFMRPRSLRFAISGLIVLIRAVSLAVNGLNFGIDFKGGT